MEQLNEGMEDLLRKAGDLYPLKTTESDWEGVLSKMRAENLGDQSAAPGLNPKGNKRRWGILLLLIPIGLGSIIYFSPARKKQITVSSPAAAQKNSLLQPDAADKKTAGAAQIQHDKQTAAGKPGMNHGGLANATGESDHKKIPDNRLSGINKFSGKAAENSKSKIAGRTGLNAHSANASETNAALAVSVPAPPSQAPARDLESKSVPAAIILADPAAKAEGSAVSDQKEIAPVQDSLSARATPKDSATTASSAKKAAAQANSVKGIYIGFLAGPDWSTVKLQSVSQTGFSLGFTIGYRFSNRLAVESGLFWDKKYYNSGGEYFNTGKLPVQPPPKIRSLTGYCDMFEIPIDFRYDFANHPDHGFFAKIGFSTYIMKKEDYSFITQSGYPMNPPPYYNTTRSFMSILQLSGGYEHAISKKTKIQIEPYIKIPLQGVGIGDMPISSAGIYFGITYSFK